MPTADKQEHVEAFGNVFLDVYVSAASRLDRVKTRFLTARMDQLYANHEPMIHFNEGSPATRVRQPQNRDLLTSLPEMDEILAELNGKVSSGYPQPLAQEDGPRISITLSWFAESLLAHRVHAQSMEIRIDSTHLEERKGPLAPVVLPADFLVIQREQVVEENFAAEIGEI